MSAPTAASGLGSRPQSAGRLLVSGSILVDLMLKVDALPAPGGDVLTEASEFTVGGGFNVLMAAHRQGMRTLYAGRRGTGPLGQMVADALRAVGAETVIAPVTSGDSGFCVVMVDASGERTMLTSMGVDAELTASELGSIRVDRDDTVYVSGYDLAYPHGPIVAAWLDDLGAEQMVIFDPGPLAAEIPPALRDAVLDRTRWISLSAAESRAITGLSDHAAAAAAILTQHVAMCGVVIRDGARGCLLAVRGHDPEPIAGFPADVVDSTGAGDCHVGAFAAALAAGRCAADACRWANAAASIAVTRWGPATAPTYQQTAAVFSCERP